MGITPPKLDDRDFEKIVEEFKSLVPYYTPGWQPEEQGAGFALVKIFAHMKKTILQQLNQIPEKHFISFLDRVGVKQLPAQSAEVPVTFTLAEGTVEHVLIPSGTRIASGEILFETEKSILAAPAKLVAAHGIDRESDRILGSPPHIVSGGPVNPFETTLHYIAKVGDTEIFVKNTEGFAEGDLLLIGRSEYAVISEISDTKIVLAHKLGFGDIGCIDLSPIAVKGVGSRFAEILYNANIRSIGGLLEYKDRIGELAAILEAGEKEPEELEDYETLSGYILGNAEMCELDKNYEEEVNQLIAPVHFISVHFMPLIFNFHLAGKPVKKVTQFELFIGKNLQQHILYLGHNDLFNITGPAAITLKFNEAFPGPGSVDWEYSGVDSEGLETWHSLNTTGGKTEFVLNKDTGDEITEHEIEGIKSRWIRCKVKDGCIDSVKKTRVDTVKLEVSSSTSGGASLFLDMAFYNDVPADLTIENNEFKTPIYPFGMNPVVHDTFYFASQEAFSKKNLNIDITFHLSQCGKPGAEGIALSWEYWNGNGWIVIPNVTDNTINFTMSPLNVTFLCPKDIELTQVNGQENYWIRTRIIQGGYSERTFVPFQEDIFIYYDENYPTAFIKKEFSKPLAEKIKEVLIRKNLKCRIGGAQELKIYMETKRNGIVVMTMDIAPDTVYKGEDLLVIKDWLENGGILIWIGLWEFFHYGKSDGKYERVEEKGERLVFDIQEDITARTGGRVEKSSIGNAIIPSLSEFDSRYPAILTKLEEQGFVYEAYAEAYVTDKKGNIEEYADPVLFRRPKPQFGTFVKFHMEAITSQNEVDQIAVELGEFIENRFFIFSDLGPPVVKKMIINYSAGNEPGSDNSPEHCLMYNNLQFTDKTEECKTVNKPFNPFIPLYDEDPSLYLAFDKKPEKGPISIFFSIEEQLGVGEEFPRVAWEYYTLDRGWIKLDAVDNTRGLTRTGVIQFVFPLDFQKKKIFGKDAYWIRAAIPGETNVTTKINGIFLNTTWATQAETVIDEIIGSGDGTKDQTFTLSKTPVISETVRVNELKTLAAEEQEHLVEENQYEVNEVKDDETEEVIERRVTWKPVDRLLDSSKEDRHYEIDRVTGKIRFGDGIHGKILPNGTDNVNVNYRSGGGTIGNLPANEIKDIKSSIPFIDKAFNPLPSEGGTDVEDIENTLERGPRILKHRNRAVTVEDFEQITLAASRHIAKATCLPNYKINGLSNDFNIVSFDNSKTFVPGCVTMIVIPQSSQAKPRLSLQLKREVEKHLHQHAPHILVEENAIQVAEPFYIEISTEVEIITTTIDQIPAVEKKSIAALDDFLAPLTGGKEKKGWELGRMPCFSDFYSLLEKVEGVDHVDDLSLILPAYDKDRKLKREEIADIVLPPHALVCSGTHEITKITADFKTQNRGD